MISLLGCPVIVNRINGLGLPRLIYIPLFMCGLSLIHYMESLPKPSFFIGIIGIRIPTNQPGFKTVDYFISPSDPITSPLEVASAGTCAAIFLSFTLRSLEDLV